MYSGLARIHEREKSTKVFSELHDFIDSVTSCLPALIYSTEHIISRVLLIARDDGAVSWHT